MPRARSLFLFVFLVFSYSCNRWWWLGRSSQALKHRIDRRWIAHYRH
jgi:hypothetical protein